MKKKQYTKIRIVPSVTLMFGLIFLYVLSYGVGLFIVIFEPCRSQLLYEHPFVFCFCIFICFVCPIGVFFGTLRRVWSIVTIDEKGIRRVVFGKFFKMEMTWEEIKEIRYYQQVLPFLFISKNISLDGMCMDKYNKILKRHDVIQIGISDKIFNVITRYYDKRILSLPDAIEKELYNNE